MTSMEKILDDQLTNAVMSGLTTPETAEWWRHQPYSGDKAAKWYDDKQRWIDTELGDCRSHRSNYLIER